MDIVQRTVDAVTAYNTLAMLGEPKIVSASIMADDTYDLSAQPNILYVGNAEYHELRRGYHHSLPDRAGNVHFMGMRIVEVRLDSWLQVTYVRFAK